MAIEPVQVRSSSRKRSGRRVVLAVLGTVGSIVSIIQFFWWLAESEPPTGPLLAVLLAAPLLVLLIATYVLAAEFGKQVKATIESNTAQLSAFTSKQMESMAALQASSSEHAERIQTGLTKVQEELHQMESSRRLTEEIIYGAH